MDRDVIADKLESLRRCLERVRDRCPVTPEELMANIDAQDIVALNLTRAVQICVDLAAHVIADLPVSPPESMGEAFSLLQTGQVIDGTTCLALQRAVGFRNLAVHSYRNIDWQIVHRICCQHLTDFEHFAIAINQYAGRP